MAQLFRWQWMWKSRSRLLGLAAVAIAFGSLMILYALTRPGQLGKPHFMIIIGGIWLIALGGYQILQGLFSPGGAFGDHDAKVKPRRLRRKKVPEQDPLPMSQDSSDSHESL